jgi:hypothetical protein
MPALNNLSASQYPAFQRCVTELVAADERVDLFEWMLGHVSSRRLAPKFEKKQRIQPRVKYYALKPVREHIGVLLSTLARSGHRGGESIRRAFDQALRHLPQDARPELIDPDRCGLRQVDTALSALNTLGPRQKRTVVTACAACITADKRVTPDEAELLRAVSDALGCPMPPLLPGQALV